jgi:hypothetical protein
MIAIGYATHPAIRTWTVIVVVFGAIKDRNVMRIGVAA